MRDSTTHPQPRLQAAHFRLGGSSWVGDSSWLGGSSWPGSLDRAASLQHSTHFNLCTVAWVSLLLLRILGRSGVQACRPGPLRQCSLLLSIASFWVCMCFSLAWVVDVAADVGRLASVQNLTPFTTNLPQKLFTSAILPFMIVGGGVRRACERWKGRCYHCALPRLLSCVSEGVSQRALVPKGLVFGSAGGATRILVSIVCTSPGSTCRSLLSPAHECSTLPSQPPCIALLQFHRWRRRSSRP